MWDRKAGLLLLVASLLIRPPILRAGDTSEPSIRAARSVHLNYPSEPAVSFYNEVTIEKSTPGSYFMVCGWSHGYFGLQEQGGGRKVAIFSVWDPTRGDEANQVPLEQRVEVLYQGDGVEVKRFGGEGTGGQSFLPFGWKTGQTYRCLVTAEMTDQKTAYAGYLWMPDTQNWKHLVTFRTRTGGDALNGIYSFIEDFRRDGHSAGEARRAIFGNGWTMNAAGKWKPLAQARFTASGADWEARDSIDAGVEHDRFYLQTGGDTIRHRELGTALQCRPSAEPPVAPPKD